MKLTSAQLRRIIKEEAQKIFKESHICDYILEIPNISQHAEGADMTAEELVAHIIDLGNAFDISFDTEDMYSDIYSDEYDAITAYGSRKELTRFAKMMDEELMGGAQSIADEDSFVNGISAI